MAFCARSWHKLLARKNSAQAEQLGKNAKKLFFCQYYYPFKPASNRLRADFKQAVNPS